MNTTKFYQIVFAVFVEERDTKQSTRYAVEVYLYSVIQSVCTQYIVHKYLYSYMHCVVCFSCTRNF